MQPLKSSISNPIEGGIRVPGDKSMSHRSLLIGALAVGETVIEGLLEGEDVLCTAAALRALGAGVERGEDGVWRVQGVGLGGLREPPGVLDMGNSGTAARLLMGVLASHPLTAFLTGDAVALPPADGAGPGAAGTIRRANRRARGRTDAIGDHRRR